MSDTYSDGGRIEIDGPDGFRMIPDTLIFNSVIKDLDVRLYGVLLWHGRSGNGIFPGRKLLALELGKSSVRTIDSSFDRLQEQGYLTITPQWDETGGQDRNRYRLHFHPLPPEQRQQREITPAVDTRTLKAQVSPPVQKIARGSSSAAEPGEGGAKNCAGGSATDCTGPAQKSAHHKGKELKRNEGEEKEDLPPAVGGLQVGEGPGRAAVPAGADKPATTNDPDQPRPSVAPAAAVYEQLPEELRRRISRGASGKVLAVIQRELATRSPAELVERIERRWTWWQHKGERVNDPVAAAITVVQARHCANQRCEDGQDLDTGVDCPACRGGRGHRTEQPPTAPGPAAVAPAPVPVSNRPDSVTVAEALTPVIDDGHDEPRPRPVKAPTGRGEAAQNAINALRASLGPRKLTAREKELQAAKRRYCERCGADEGNWCVNSDGHETPGLIHSVRVVSVRTAAQADPGKVA
ncbi:helix-turn-helix domain-containing protein [Streptosporangium sandarakinum]|uniref:Helix-turn-helix domain-containing protein n=1 Tax=Streptosporangium sandarakinum TaxID=1260955 RepID=A0A852VEF4_9ACTN|nr:hypothetical protein [Streptosporangium sandarakinum]NYF44575.1 hypothetical protein [Streptosporangium sandarakinum]